MYIPKKKAWKREKPDDIPLTSMMDTFTNILLFLLMSYSASGGLMQPNKNLVLPNSVQDKPPKKVTSILVANNAATGVRGVLEDREGPPMYIDFNEALDDPSKPILDGLQTYLAGQRKMELDIGRVQSEEITIQCDQTVPYNWLLKVIGTCGAAGYGDIQFVVKKQTT